MKSARIAAALLVVTALTAPARASTERPCRLPEPRLVEYSTERIEVEVAVDYSGCSWWGGSMIQIEGELAQATAGTPVGEGIGTFAACGTLGESHRAQGSRPRVTRCKILLSLAHLPVDASTYSGTVRFAWRGGEREVSFSYDCYAAVAVATCL